MRDSSRRWRRKSLPLFPSQARFFRLNSFFLWKRFRISFCLSLKEVQTKRKEANFDFTTKPRKSLQVNWNHCMSMFIDLSPLLYTTSLITQNKKSRRLGWVNNRKTKGKKKNPRDKKYGRRTSSWRKQEKGFISDRGKNLFFLLTEKRDLYQEGLHCLFPSDSTVAPGICILDDKERGDSNSRSSSCCWCLWQKKNIMQETLREDKEQVYWCHCIRNKLPLELPSRQVTQRRWVGTSG